MQSNKMLLKLCKALKDMSLKVSRVDFLLVI